MDFDKWVLTGSPHTGWANHHRRGVIGKAYGFAEVLMIFSVMRTYSLRPIFHLKMQYDGCTSYLSFIQSCFEESLRNLTRAWMIWNDNLSFSQVHSQSLSLVHCTLSPIQQAEVVLLSIGILWASSNINRLRMVDCWCVCLSVCYSVAICKFDSTPTMPCVMGKEACVKDCTCPIRDLCRLLCQHSIALGDLGLPTVTPPPQGRVPWIKKSRLQAASSIRQDSSYIVSNKLSSKAAFDVQAATSMHTAKQPCLS